MKNYFVSKFVEVVGEPNFEKLFEYLEFVLEYDISSVENTYSEVHHILPRNFFPDLIKEDFNLVCLKYEDHVKAHILLSDAYPKIYSLARTLNWMLNDKQKFDIGYYEKHRAHCSRISKAYWESIRDTPKYDAYIETISNNMKNGQAHYMCGIYYNKMNGREIQSKNSKEMWEKEGIRTKIITSLRITNAKSEIKEKRSKAVQKRWNTISDEKYLDFCKTMEIVNKDEKKRADAGKIIKDLWANDREYKEKMRNRKTRGSDGSNLKSKWKESEFKEKQAVSRLAQRVKTSFLLSAHDKVRCESMSNKEVIDTFGHLCKNRKQIIAELKSIGLYLHSKLTIEELRSLYKENFCEIYKERN